MYSLPKKRHLSNALIGLIQKADELSLPLDAELTNTKILDRISVALAGYTVTLQLLLEQLQGEIALETDQAAMQRQFEDLFAEEQRRFNKQQPLSMPPPADVTSDDDDDEEDIDPFGGLSEGM